MPATDQAKRRLRIGLDVTPLAAPLTGIGVFVDRLVRGLAETERVDLVGLAFTARGRAVLRETLPASVSLARPIPAAVGRRAWSRGDRPDVSALASNLRVVHGTNFITPPSKHATELVSIHDMGPWLTPELSGEVATDLPLLVDRSLARGAHVHADSHFVAEQVVAELDVAPERVHVIHLGVDPAPDRPAPMSAELADRIGGRPIVVAVGTIERRKGFDRLVEAFADLLDEVPGLCLVLAGGHGNASLAVEATIRRHRLVDQVIVTGYVSDDDKAALLRDAEVVVSSAIHEGFGFVPLEAMAVGTPAVATAGGSIPEICGDAASLVPVGDGDALAAAMHRVVTDDAHRAELIAAGLERAAAFSWQATVEGFLELYETIA